MADLTDDELGLLVWCAVSYDRRWPRRKPGLPRVPDHIWDMLNLEWQGRINDGTSLDAFGAEVRTADSE